MDDGAERSFEATPSRIERAKREGDLAKSQEVTTIAAFACALLASTLVVSPIAGAARAAIVAAATGAGAIGALATIAAAMLVPVAAAALGAVAATHLQTGGLHIVPPALKFERLHPGEGLKRMFSRESVVTAVRAAAAFTCAACALVPAFAAVYGAALQGAGIGAMANAAWSGALRAATIACAVGGCFAALDFALQFQRWRKKLRMSYHELRRDRREQDGDPLAQGRRRQLHRQIARGSLRRVKDAAFVLTNPTHLAIALEYRPPEVPVPRVLVRAADEMAMRVRDLAREHGIAIVENVALARELYAKSRAGEVIPRSSYVAVAEVVAQLQRARVL